jgi:vitamin B12 transporter
LNTGGFKPENDDYENVTVSGRVDAQLLDDGAAKVVFRLGDSEFGNFFSNNFLAVPDPNARQKDQVDYVRGEWGQSPLEHLRYKLAFGFARADQQFRDPPDAGETSLTDSDILSETYDGEAQSTLGWWEEKGETTVGVDYEVQRGNVDSLFSDPAFGDSITRFDRDTRTVAGYAMNHLALDQRRLVFLAGVRVDDNSRFGRAVSPSGGASYSFEATGTRLRGTYGEGFKAPTLNQLFFPGFGNPDLGAETSWEVDGGIDQPLLAGRALVSGTYFHRVVNDLIEGVPQPSGILLAENVGTATVDGIEGALEVIVAEGLRAGGAYTFLDVDANSSGRVRRPRHSGSIHLDADRGDLYVKGDRATVRARLLLVGERPDFDPVAGFAVRDNQGYQRADLAVAYDWPLAALVVRKVGVFARVENLFDRHYQEVLGFGARPLNVLAGMRVEF